jgi:hypothetical protein
MASFDPAERGGPTSHALCERALRAYERLYRLLDCDDPDLAANVTFTAGRVRLLRLAAAAPWTLPESAVRAVVELIERAERSHRPTEAEPLFATFVEDVCRYLDRRGARAAAPAPLPGRRAADRLRAVAVEPEPRSGPAAVPSRPDPVALPR